MGPVAAAGAGSLTLEPALVLGPNCQGSKTPAAGPHRSTSRTSLTWSSLLSVGVRVGPSTPTPFANFPLRPAAESGSIRSTGARPRLDGAPIDPAPLIPRGRAVPRAEVWGVDLGKHTRSSPSGDGRRTAGNRPSVEGGRHVSRPHSCHPCPGSHRRRSGSDCRPLRIVGHARIIQRWLVR